MATIMKKKFVLERDDKDRVLMTKKNLLSICEEDGLYEFAELNTKIYLHFKGFYQIENLETFVNLKAIYLENNFIKTIQGLSQLKQLEHLMLQHNLIENIEGLEENTALKSLNLSQNIIKKIDGLSTLRNLESLSVSSNRLSDAESIQKLTELPSLSCCGLEDNQITYSEETMKVFEGIVNLKVLYLQNNEFIRECPQYRKTVIGKLRLLKYLDERPVFEDERQLSEAFLEGGKEKMNALVKEKAARKEEQKLKEREESRVKREELKLRRLGFFENQLKRGLMEIEGLKRKLNRARLICDGAMIEQLNEALNKENRLVTELEDMIKLMKEGQRQLQQARLKNGETQENKSDVNRQSDGILLEDIEILLSAVLHGATREEDFKEENVLESLLESVQCVADKIGGRDNILTSIAPSQNPGNNDQEIPKWKQLITPELITNAISKFNNANPQHLVTLINARNQALFPQQPQSPQLRQLEQRSEHTESDSNNNSTQSSYVSVQDSEEASNYLDDLE